MLIFSGAAAFCFARLVKSGFITAYYSFKDSDVHDEKKMPQN